jgi:hypothetical protein
MFCARPVAPEETVGEMQEGVEEAAEVLRGVMAEVGDRQRPADVADPEQWLEAAAAVVGEARELDVSGWLCTVAALTLWGPRTAADADALASIVAEAEGGDRAVLGPIFTPVVSRWRELGALDDQDRLTALGWWGLPEALLRAWS